MRKTLLALAASALAFFGLGFTAGDADAQTQVYRDAYGRPVLTMGPPSTHPQYRHRPRPQSRPYYGQPRPYQYRGPQRQMGGRYAYPSHYQSRSHQMHRSAHQKTMMYRRIVRSYGPPAVGGAAIGAAIASNPRSHYQGVQGPAGHPTGQPYVPPRTIVENGIQYTGLSCTLPPQAGGGLGREGFGNDGRKGCWKY